MDPKIIIEAVGYTGSLLVVVSMLMTSVKKLRIVNTTGSVIFMIYALIIHSYPTALMNLCLVIINLYRLFQLEKKERHFKLIKVRPGEGMAEHLMEYYGDDIRQFFPDASGQAASECSEAFLVTCDAQPAGLFLGSVKEEGVLDVLADYATPTYRDYSVGAFLYPQLKEYGISRIRFSGRSNGHEEYMEKMGFVRQEDGFVKEL